VFAILALEQHPFNVPENTFAIAELPKRTLPALILPVTSKEVSVPTLVDVRSISYATNCATVA